MPKTTSTNAAVTTKNTSNIVKNKTPGRPPNAEPLRIGDKMYASNVPVEFQSREFRFTGVVKAHSCCRTTGRDGWFEVVEGKYVDQITNKLIVPGGGIFNDKDASVHIYAEDGTIEYKGGFSVRAWVFSGKGTQFARDGTSIHGGWNNGNPDGRVVHTNTDGSFYECDYKDGKMTWQGPLLTREGVSAMTIETSAHNDDGDSPYGDDDDEDSDDTMSAKRRKISHADVKAAGNDAVDNLKLDAKTTAKVKDVVVGAMAAAVQNTATHNAAPEREFVRKTAAEWGELGIECIGKEARDEIRMKAADGTTRRLDLQISKGDQVALCEFKADPADFLGATSQLIGYERRIRSALDKNGRQPAYTTAHTAGKSSLIVVTPSKPDAFDIETMARNLPPVKAWWTGQPPPLM